MNTFIEIGAGFIVNLAVVFLIIRFIYYPQQRSKEYVFTFFTFNTIIFFVMGVLNDTNLSVGVGFGLFGMFSILRYRTETIPIREMTYLFVLIALAVVNSLLFRGRAFGELLVVNVAIIAVLYVLERGWGFQYETRKSITYERFELVRLGKWPELLADLKERTGLPIKHIEIGDLNFLRDSALITIYCDADAINNSQVKLVSSEPRNND